MADGVGDFQSQLIESLSSTGYLLEYDCCRALSERGWHILSNRYYVDDATRQQREMDILAYRARTIQDIDYYTVLIISCKKNEEASWVFVTKPLQERDPNLVRYPNSTWTNSKVLSFMSRQHPLEKAIEDDIFFSERLTRIYERTKDIFAFQLIRKTNWKCQDDKAIYDSIITSVKALSYERDALNARKCADSYYAFYLVTVFRGDMVELRFNDRGESTAHQIDEIKYCNRHIVNNREDHYRVHFVRDTAFPSLVDSFGQLHEWLTDHIEKLVTDYYSKFFEYEGGIDLFAEEIRPGIIRMVNHRLQTIYSGPKDIRIENLLMEYDTSKRAFMIDPFVTDRDAMNLLIHDETLKSYLKKELHKYYHYEGDIQIEDLLFE
jgi:hypothetical protein